MPAKAAHQSFASFWRASVRALLLWDFNNDPLTGSLQLGSFFRGETSAVISTTCAHLVRDCAPRVAAQAWPGWEGARFIQVQAGGHLGGALPGVPTALGGERSQVRCQGSAPGPDRWTVAAPRSASQTSRQYQPSFAYFLVFVVCTLPALDIA